MKSFSIPMLLALCRVSVHTGLTSAKLGEGTVTRTNTTAHLVFNTISSLLQHWPNTIYRNGHTLVPATIPFRTLLQHGRSNPASPSSPEYFAFDIDHAFLFCLWPPCLLLTYAARRDLHLGYFDGTSASVLAGPRDFQDVLFNDGFTAPEDYNAWKHANASCAWANELGLDGIVRMEQSFEVILCDMEATLALISKNELVYPESLIVVSGEKNSSSLQTTVDNRPLHPRTVNQAPMFPEPNQPARPAPPGWKGKQITHMEMAFEAIRAGMWHNRMPGEYRIKLDYSGIVSAYDESFTSLVASRRGVPRSSHRLDGISVQDKARIRAEVQDVLKRERRTSSIDWQSLFQSVIDRFADRLEGLRYILRQSDADPIQIVAAARHKLLATLSPYMVLPQAASQMPSLGHSVILGSEPDSDWFERIYEACASHVAAGVPSRGSLTKRERVLSGSINGVQAEICATLTRMWASAFDSEERNVYAKRMVGEWLEEIETLMAWLDWHLWVKCDPPCGPGLICTLATWPWEIVTGREDLGPTCRDKMLDI